jgi:hypothetical protein
LTSYYHERAAIETAYVASLQKLSSRLHSGGSSSVFSSVSALGYEGKDEERQLGAWKDVRRCLENEVGEMGRVHEVYRRKVVEEVEGALKASLSSEDWTRWGENDARLAATVKDYEGTVDKLQKVGPLYYCLPG